MVPLLITKNTGDSMGPNIVSAFFPALDFATPKTETSISNYSDTVNFLELLVVMGREKGGFSHFTAGRIVTAGRKN